MRHRIPMAPVKWEETACGTLRRTTYRFDLAQGPAEYVRLVAGDLEALRANEEWHIRNTRLLSEPSRLHELDDIAAKYLGHAPVWRTLDEVAA